MRTARLANAPKRAERAGAEGIEDALEDLCPLSIDCTPLLCIALAAVVVRRQNGRLSCLNSRAGPRKPFHDHKECGECAKINLFCHH